MLPVVLHHQACNSGGISRIRAGIDLIQNARIILCTAYIAKDLKNIVKAGAVLIDEAGLDGRNIGSSWKSRICTLCKYEGILRAH